ncbi:hypothetical protein CORT_0A01560 [Candida orthopsilosis Co 90-125]|uniref:Membrane transporter n=1 Tax=Candida orthopsilosis (strain 90-125) TaxID=1136231 RepID=H8WVS4_CANO9|nr:hypothetical protein CORT_0A01560 [Candida orthopsilosis Co 90-125]CCG20547.1 hypothetical protein CORT_0A01560 [Candida orthopsilosis Co 90-125]
MPQDNQETEHLLDENSHYDSLSDQHNDSDYEDDDITYIKQQIKQNATKPFYKRPSVFAVIFLIGLLTLSSSSAEGSRQSLIYAKALESTKSEKKVPYIVARFNQYFLVGTTATALVPIAKFGEVSSVYGRKLYFVMVIITITVSRMLQYYLFRNYTGLQFGKLLLANYVSCLFGGVNIIGALTESYVSDFTLPESRIFQFGLASSATFIGQSIGPLIGTSIGKWAEGKLNSGISEADFTILRFELVVLLVLSVYVVTLFPESRNELARERSEEQLVEQELEEEGEERDDTSDLDTNVNRIVLYQIFKSFDIIQPMKILTYPGGVAKVNKKHGLLELRFVVVSLVLIYALYQTLLFSLNQVVIEYGQYQFHWNSDNISYLLSTISISRAISLVFILPFFEKTLLKKTFALKSMNRSFDMVEYVLMLLSFGVAIFVFLAFYSANSKGFYIAAGCFSFDALIGPVFDSTIIKFFPNSSSGQVYGAITLLVSLMNLVSPILITWIYELALNVGHANLVYLFYAFWMGLFILVIYLCKRVLHLNRTTTDKELKRIDSDGCSP